MASMSGKNYSQNKSKREAAAIGESRRRKINKNKANIILHCCSDCGFKSKRLFNVSRHYERIHEPTKKKIKCCGKRYLTKGQFYQHCANVHPELRKASILTEKKYKIIPSSLIRNDKKMRTRRWRSLRNIKPKIEAKKECMNDDDFYLNENTPLINYLKDPKLMMIKREEELKKEEKEEKFEQEYLQDTKLKYYKNVEINCIEIFFNGDATSPVHAKMQKEFLRNIDFENFKLIY